jgi:anti-repressor protein
VRLETQDQAAALNVSRRSVLSSIRSIVATAPKTGVRNFTRTTFIGSNRETYPRFDMNRDGFSLLAMGLTGTKAGRH